MKEGLKRVQRKRLSDQIIEQITSLITSGRLKVGNKLPAEHVLMKQLGVGRSSLREAIRALTLTGVLSVGPGRGTYITDPPNRLLEGVLDWNVSIRKEKIKQFFEARIVLEEAIVGLVVKNATESDIAELQKKLTDLKTAKTDTEKFVQADLAFHLTLAKASHNEVLYGFFNELRPLLRAWNEQARRLFNSQGMDVERDKHAKILEAIERRDSERAQLYMREYLEKSSQDLTAQLVDKQMDKLIKYMLAVEK